MLAHLPIELTLTVLIVAGDRMAERGRMHPCLVGATGIKPHFHQGGGSEDALGRKLARCCPALGGHCYPPFSGTLVTTLKRRGHVPRAAAPTSANKREITLLDCVSSPHVMQRDQNPPALGEQQTAR